MLSFFRNSKGAGLIEYQYVGIIAIIAIVSVGMIGPIIIGKTERNTVTLTDSGMSTGDIGFDDSLSSTNPVDTGENTTPEEPEYQMRYACFNEGIVAGGQTRIRSVNSFSEGFCLHGNEGVWLRNNNIFAFGAIISAPDQTMVYTPGGSDNNEGVEEAFQIAKLDIDIPQTLSEAFNYLIDPSLNGRPDYLNQTAPVINVSGNRLDVSTLQRGNVYNIACDRSKPLDFEGAIKISQVGILTNCNLKFPNNFLIEDSVIATTSTDARSINSPTGLQIGRDDTCADGGGAQLLTMGGMDIASNLQIYGGHIVAAQTINIAAWVDGEGALLLSGQNIEGKTNITMISCNGIGMDDNLELTWWEYLISFFL